MFQSQTFASLTEANEFAQTKAAELSLQLNTKVHPICLLEKESPLDIAIGFLKTPIRAAKLQAVSILIEKGKVESGNYLLQLCLIKEESDPRIGSENPIYDDINVGAILSTNKVLSSSIDIYEETKKK
jgi:hypothetical protein